MKRFFTACALMTIASSAASQDVALGLGLSSFGGNIELSSRIDPSFGVRGAYWGGTTIDYEDEDDGTSIEGEATLSGVALMADYYPTRSNWRISGGILFSNSEVSATGTENVEGTDISVTSTAEFANGVAPLIATGYEFELSPHWSLSTEAGVIFTGGIDVSVVADDGTQQSEIDDDQDIQDAIDDAADLQVFPHIGVLVSYRF